MPVKYNMYLGVNEDEILQFEQLWNKLSPHLEPFPRMIHQGRDAYAAVFNSWIRYKKLGQPLVIKPNRMFAHGIVHVTSEKLQQYMPSIILEQLIDYKDDLNFIFIHCYNLTRIVLTELEDYLLKNSNHLDYIKFEYYFINDDEVDNGSGIYMLLKEIIYGFVNQFLDEKLIKSCYYKSMEQTRYKYVQLKELDSLQVGL